MEKTQPEVFVQFVSFMMNDLNYSIEEGFLKLRAIKEMEQLILSQRWQNMPVEEKKEKEESNREAERMAEVDFDVMFN